MTCNSKSKKKLQEIKIAIGEKEYLNALKFSKILVSLSKLKKIPLEEVKILIGYGGGKDSTWVLVFTRLTQLICKEQYKKTFTIKIITMVHLGTSRDTLKNIEKVYYKLGIYEDRHIETPQIYSYGDIANFSINYTIPPKRKKLLRDDILMAGHRSYGDARTTFCNSCNLHMISSFISNLDKKTHFIITGDSTDELKEYYSWIQNIQKTANLPIISSSKSFLENCKSIKKMRKQFYKDLIGSKSSEKDRFQDKNFLIFSKFQFLPIFDFTDYSIKKHWNFFNKFLEFNFSKSLFFSETDCSHPNTMCHLRGLTAELSGRNYSSGVKEYLKLAKHFMIQKEFHEDIIKQNFEKFDSEEKIQNFKKIQSKLVEENFGINEKQLICMIFSPITNKGENLEKYIKYHFPTYLKKIKEIHKVLKGKHFSEEIELFLIKITGLEIEKIKYLYKSNLFIHSLPRKTSSILEIISQRDLYKKKIKNEIISGR